MTHTQQQSKGFLAKSGAFFWDQSTHRGCLVVHQAFLDSHCPDHPHDRAYPGLDEGARIVDAAVVAAVPAAASAALALT